MSSDEKAIRDLIDTWLRASKAGDVAAIRDLDVGREARELCIYVKR